MPNLFLRASGIVPPAQAVAAGYTKLYFNDDFTSTASIDMSNTGATGFNWYPRNAWPNCTDAVPGNWRFFAAYDTSSLSVSNSVLTLTNNNFSGTGGVCLMTAVDNGSGGFNGFACPVGWYIESRIKYDAGASVNGIGLFCMPTEFLTGQTTTFVEPDIFESFTAAANSSHSIILNWVYTNSTSGSSAGAGYYEASHQLPPIDYSAGYNVIGMLWKPISIFGIPGSYSLFANNVEMNRDNPPWPPGGTTYSTAGENYGSGEGQHCVPIIFQGNSTVHYDWVRVWGPP